RRLNLDVRGITVLIVINLAITFIVPGISWTGHIGGLVTGAALSAALAYAPKENRTRWQLMAVAGFVVLLAVLVVVRVPMITFADRGRLPQVWKSSGNLAPASGKNHPEDEEREPDEQVPVVQNTDEGSPRRHIVGGDPQNADDPRDDHRRGQPTRADLDLLGLLRRGVDRLLARPGLRHWTTPAGGLGFRIVLRLCVKGSGSEPQDSRHAREMAIPAGRSRLRLP